MAKSADSQTHADFPGVVAEWSSFRVIVARSPDGSFYYRLQVLIPAVRSPVPKWVPVEASSSPSLEKLLGKLAPSTAGLVQAVEGLPDDPGQASPSLVEWYRLSDARFGS